MKKIFYIVVSIGMLFADANVSVDKNSTKVKKVVDKNSSKTISKKVLSKKEILKKQLQKQIEREKKYAKEQKFYKGKEYNLKDKEIDENSLQHIKAIEPDYDFDITDVYRDDI